MATLRRLPAGVSIALSMALLLLGWQMLTQWGDYDSFILPGPGDVARQFVLVLQDGRLPKHTLITISEVIPGLLIGILVAAPLGYLLAKSPWPSGSSRPTSSLPRPFPSSPSLPCSPSGLAPPTGAG